MSRNRFQQSIVFLAEAMTEAMTRRSLLNVRVISYFLCAVCVASNKFYFHYKLELLEEVFFWICNWCNILEISIHRDAAMQFWIVQRDSREIQF